MAVSLALHALSLNPDNTAHQACCQMVQKLNLPAVTPIHAARLVRMDPGELIGGNTVICVLENGALSLPALEAQLDDRHRLTQCADGLMALQSALDAAHERINQLEAEKDRVNEQLSSSRSTSLEHTLSSMRSSLAYDTVGADDESQRRETHWANKLNDTQRSHERTVCHLMEQISGLESRLEQREIYLHVHGEQPPSNLSLIHISEPTRLLSISYAVFCLKKKKTQKRQLRQKM
eukprot:TRINITY_DN12442_c0_g1_i4.p1 TRINITY_DN12442_c0_g1~~TRINITY_DN12442_c0_g1_i4.p1  ORF type:complete len:235 (-),score=42.66 TRINITY_DN12442_c0_g1_i4:74-778(-)